MIRFQQRLQIDGTIYAAGDTADLPAQVALAVLRRGSAERCEAERQRQPEQNRIRKPGQNRKRRAKKTRSA